jgi:hypothetical protein
MILERLGGMDLRAYFCTYKLNASHNQKLFNFEFNKKPFFFQFILLFLFFPFLDSQNDFLYDYKIPQQNVVDHFNNIKKFPAANKINIVIFIKPSEKSHVIDTNKIGFIVDEFMGAVEYWIVCSHNSSLNNLPDKWNWISSDKNKITSIIKDYYCPDCSSLLIIKENRVKFYSATINMDFIREWLKENI